MSAEPYVNHIALTLDGAHAGPLMSMMRWRPAPTTWEEGDA